MYASTRRRRILICAPRFPRLLAVTVYQPTLQLHTAIPLERLFHAHRCRSTTALLMLLVFGQPIIHGRRKYSNKIRQLLLVCPVICVACVSYRSHTYCYSRKQEGKNVERWQSYWLCNRSIRVFCIRHSVSSPKTQTLVLDWCGFSNREMAAVCSQKMAVRNQIPNPLPSDSFGLRCEKYFSELNRW